MIARRFRAKGRTTRRIPGKMNKTEGRYDLILKAQRQRGEIHTYRFEAVTLRLADRTTYTPDFAVMLPDGVIEFREIKGGFVREDGWLKLKIAAEQYPEFQFVLCQEIKGSWTIKNL